MSALCTPSCVQAPKASQHARGFTLVEVLVVVAVLGILSAVVYPSYSNYVLRARRVDAKTALLDLASREERYYSVNNLYSNNGTALGYATTFPVAINVSGNVYYNLSAPVLQTTPSPGYLAAATPVASQTADTSCYAFQINQLGLQTNVDANNAALAGTGCW